MRFALLALLSVLPLAEIAVLVWFGQWAGVWLTLAVVIGTALIGVGVLQRQGFAMMLRTQEAIMRGEPPVGAMMEGGLTVMAGFLLIMPGLITDTLGFLLLIPPVRQIAARWMAAGMFGIGAADVDVEIYEKDYRRPPPAGPGASPNGGPVIEGDFERIDERKVDPRDDRPNSRPRGGR